MFQDRPLNLFELLSFITALILILKIVFSLMIGEGDKKSASIDRSIGEIRDLGYVSTHSKTKAWD